MMCAGLHNADQGYESDDVGRSIGRAHLRDVDAGLAVGRAKIDEVTLA